MSLLELVGTLQAVVGDLDKETPTDTELADVVADVRNLEVKLADIRHRWERLTSEMEPVQGGQRVNDFERSGPPVAVGQRYELVPQFKVERSYNTSRLVTDIRKGIEAFTGNEVDLGRVLILLKERDALRFQWQWTNLKNFCHAFGITLNTGRDTILSDDSGLDDPHVGEFKKPAGVKRIAIKGE